MKQQLKPNKTLIKMLLIGPVNNADMMSPLKAG